MTSKLHFPRPLTIQRTYAQPNSSYNFLLTLNVGKTIDGVLDNCGVKLANVSLPFECNFFKNNFSFAKWKFYYMEMLLDEIIV